MYTIVRLLLRNRRSRLPDRPSEHPEHEAEELCQLPPGASTHVCMHIHCICKQLDHFQLRINQIMSSKAPCWIHINFNQFSIKNR